MTPIQMYDAAMNDADNLRKHGRKLVADGDAIERHVERELGIEHRDRGPGFACWSVDGVDGYYHSPREALEAAAKETNR